jgi:hypothetical protein
VRKHRFTVYEPNCDARRSALELDAIDFVVSDLLDVRPRLGRSFGLRPYGRAE